MKVKTGDRVLVCEEAFDEQIEKLEGSTHQEFIVGETKDVSIKGTSGQWVKLQGVRLRQRDGSIKTFTDWIDSAWLKKYE